MLLRKPAKDIKADPQTFEKDQDFLDAIEQSVKEQASPEHPEDLPVVNIVDTMLQFAYHSKTSDLHIEPYEETTLVRFRIDGLLHDILTLPKYLHELIVARIKILSRLRTDEQRAAQDGKLHFTVGDKRVDVRVSTVPVVRGEKIVMRILSNNAGATKVADLGFRPEDLAIIESQIHKPWGMVLATGPTGSGKTTTLYAVLQEINKREINISTIEDPVEYDMESINQIQVNPKTGLTFASGLRAIVRQDPDVIMVGEIRDEETASIAVNSAMTGHMVLSTLHTNDSATTLPRLLDMGVPAFLVASTISIAIGQRLLRKICKHCHEAYHPEESLREMIRKEFSEGLIAQYKLDSPDLTVYRGAGCSHCQETGYKGRIGIFEVLEMTEEIKQMIMKRDNADLIKEKAVENGMLPMIEDAIQKALAGLTTFEEIFRVTQE